MIKCVGNKFIGVLMFGIRCIGNFKFFISFCVEFFSMLYWLIFFMWVRFMFWRDSGGYLGLFLVFKLIVM